MPLTQLPSSALDSAFECRGGVFSGKLLCWPLRPVGGEDPSPRTEVSSERGSMAVMNRARAVCQTRKGKGVTF